MQFRCRAGAVQVLFRCSLGSRVVRMQFGCRSAQVRCAGAVQVQFMRSCGEVHAHFRRGSSATQVQFRAKSELGSGRCKFGGLRVAAHFGWDCLGGGGVGGRATTPAQAGPAAPYWPGS